MNQAEQTYWYLWQMQKYGNALPDGVIEEYENGEQVIRDQLVWFEREEEVWLENQRL